MDELLAKALEIAQKAHAGQLDKAGRDYIQHPLRVMNKVRTEEEKMVALLHDVLEDSEQTLAGLVAAGFPAAVCRAVERLTRPQGQSYQDYISAIKQDQLATRVKLADLEDNMDLSRLPGGPSPRDEVRTKKYKDAYEFLKS
ncbi:HD domain-containing protein [Mucilaginibacter sp. HD30]